MAVSDMPLQATNTIVFAAARMSAQYNALLMLFGWRVVVVKRNYDRLRSLQEDAKGRDMSALAFARQIAIAA
jgi:hypothetical protein